MKIVAGTCALFWAAATAAAVGATDTAALRARMIADLQRDVAALQQATDAERRANRKPADFYHPYILWGLVHLHAATREERLLDWAKENLLWLTRSARDAAGRPVPFYHGFRFMGPYGDALAYLKQHHRLTAAETAEVEEQIRVIMAARPTHNDFGPHNRGMIYGAEYLQAAAALPGDPAADDWRRRGEALVYDSAHGWDMEDASIYEPFWLNFTLVVAELQGTVDAHMRRINTRYYFDHALQLLLPNGFMPEWGDGEWFQSWGWYFANFVRAGSWYRQGDYLEAARRLYEANVDFAGRLSAESIGCTGLALHWLDAAVPLAPLVQDRSHEVVDDVLSKKIVFRSPAGGYVFLNYRDQGPGGRFGRDYLNAQIAAYEEKPHHGHADENAINLLMDGGSVLLADGGYRRTFADGWRADVYHNRIAARTGFSLQVDPIDTLFADTAYHAVDTEKIHFGTFGSLDYSRTRLVDAERGYTGDRIILYAPESSLTIVVDSLLIDTSGHKLFANTWHPENILKQGDDYVVSWPPSVNDRHVSLPNPHGRDLLIQFLGNRDKVTVTREIDRRFRTSQAVFQYLQNYFFKGQRVTFVTVLRPHAAGTFAPAMLDEVTLLTNGHDDGRTLGLEFALAGEKVTVGLKLDQTIGFTNLRGRPLFAYETGAVTYGALRTDGDFAFVREKRDGTRELGFMFAIGAEYQGRPLFLMPANTTMYQGTDQFRVKDVRDKMPRWHQLAAAPARQ